LRYGTRSLSRMLKGTMSKSRRSMARGSTPSQACADPASF